MPPTHLHPSTLSARRRAAACLVQLSQALPDTLLTVFKDLCQRVLALMQGDGAHCGRPRARVRALTHGHCAAALLETEKLLLYEMLVLVSNAMPDVATQRAFLTDVLAQPIAQARSAPAAVAVAAWCLRCCDPRRSGPVQRCQRQCAPPRRCSRS